MSAKDAIMSTKDVTMSAKDATKNAIAAIMTRKDAAKGTSMTRAWPVSARP